MSDNKKYYYLKVKDNFFDSDQMIILEAMQDGYLYSNILLKLYLRSLKNDGKLMFNDRIPYNTNILSQVVRHPVGVVREALAIFKEFGLIDILDNGAIFMLDIQNYIGESSSEADRQRAYQKRVADDKQLAICKKSNIKSNRKTTPEIELEIELEKELYTPPEITADSQLMLDSVSRTKRCNYTQQFEEFYAVYPNPFDKEQTFKNFTKLLKIESFENIMTATRKYIQYLEDSKKETDKTFIKRSTNFVGKEKAYKGYLEMEAPIIPEKDTPTKENYKVRQ